MIDNSNSREPVDWRLCILCQQSNFSKVAVVLNPRTESYGKILDVVAERASVHDGQYVAIQRRLKGCTKEMLVDKEVTWRRSCYSYATNQTELQWIRNRFEQSVATGSMLWKGQAIKDQSQKWKQTYQGHQSHSQDLQQIVCQKCCAFSANWIAGMFSSQLELWTLEDPQTSSRNFRRSSVDDKIKQCNITKWCPCNRP